MNIIDLLIKKRNSDKIAIIDKGYKYSYRELYEIVNECGNEFDFANNKNVLLIMENSIEFIIAYLCILLKGKNLVLGTTKLTVKEISELIKYCEISAIVCSRHTIEKVEKVKMDVIYKCFEFSKEEICLDKKNRHQSLFVDEYKKNGCKLVLGSSGTTTVGKRAVFLQDTIIKNASMHIQSLGLTEKDVFLVYLPMCFGYCHTCQFIATLTLGATMVIGNPNFMVQEFWNNCIDYKVTSFLAVPTYIMLLNSFNGEIDAEKIQLRHICYGGAKLPKAEYDNFRNRYTYIPLLETYGMTELGPRVTTMDLENVEEKKGSVGRALNNVQIRIVDECGTVLPCHSVGNIEVRTMTRMMRYFNNDEMTEKAFHNDWFITGDVGYLDDDGYLFLTGRRKNIIISGGINIYAEEYEEIINQHDSIMESRVFGIPDKYLGEKPAVIIVVSDQFNYLEFKKYCDECFGKNKIAEILIEKEIPKTYTGKIKRSTYEY